MLVGLADDRIVASAMVGHDGHRGTMYYVSVAPARAGPRLRPADGGGGRGLAQGARRLEGQLLVRKGNEAVLGFYGELGYEPGSAQQIEKWIDPAKRGDR